ncbi:hypothetical protein D3C72_1844180 [compost metagenome]
MRPVLLFEQQHLDAEPYLTALHMAFHQLDAAVDFIERGTHAQQLFRRIDGPHIRQQQFPKLRVIGVKAQDIAHAFETEDDIAIAVDLRLISVRLQVPQQRFGDSGCQHGASFH